MQNVRITFCSSNSNRTVLLKFNNTNNSLHWNFWIRPPIHSVKSPAEITVLINYYQLCNEDYHWWWRSFTTAGSTSIYIFVYSFEFFREMEAHSFGTCVLYFGYMGLACLGLFLMIGFVGVMANLWFNMKIFGSLKVT